MVDVIENLGNYHRKIFVFLPENTVTRQIIYFHGTPEDGKGLAEKLWGKMEDRMRETGTSLVMLEVENWNRDLSPWWAERLFFKGEDFSGGGKEYLMDFCGQVVPSIERWYQGEGSVERRMIGGYSMGGLFALYALCESQIFTDMISVSGSLWYDGIKAYVSEQMCGKEHCFAREKRATHRGGSFGTVKGEVHKEIVSDVQRNAYFSLGEKEPKSRNSRMKQVGENTLSIQEMMGKQGISTYFEWNPGNHFQDVLERIEKGIQYMLDFR